MSTPNLDQQGPPTWRHVLCFSVVALLVGVDLASKSLVMPWLESSMVEFQHLVPVSASAPALVRDAHNHERYPIAGEWLGFMHNLNYGAAFGRLAGIPWVLVIGRVLASFWLSALILRSATGARVYLSSLVLILAGALGNLWDNFTYEPLIPDAARPFGPVRDFIDVYFGFMDWHFPTFNIADSCITVGAILLLLSGFGGAPKEEPDESELPA
ncbi:MAG: signal peptidase II [Planctomycetota bacterium]